MTEPEKSSKFFRKNPKNSKNLPPASADKWVPGQADRGRFPKIFDDREKFWSDTLAHHKIFLGKLLTIMKLSVNKQIFDILTMFGLMSRVKPFITDGWYLFGMICSSLNHLKLKFDLKDNINSSM